MVDVLKCLQQRPKQTAQIFPVCYSDKRFVKPSLYLRTEREVFIILEYLP